MFVKRNSGLTTLQWIDRALIREAITRMVLMRDLEYFTFPKHFEEVENVDEFGVAGASCDGVERNEDKAAVGMLLLECLEALLVFRIHVLGGFYFESHLGIADDNIHLFFVVCVPI